MKVCKFSKDCLFFNDQMPFYELLKGYKERYCQGEWKECARYMVAKKLGRRWVPDYLYPGMTDYAQKVISSKKGKLTAV